jgi:hypothetical protein
MAKNISVPQLVDPATGKLKPGVTSWQIRNSWQYQPVEHLGALSPYIGGSSFSASGKDAFSSAGASVSGSTGAKGSSSSSSSAFGAGNLSKDDMFSYAKHLADLQLDASNKQMGAASGYRAKEADQTFKHDTAKADQAFKHNTSYSSQTFQQDTAKAKQAFGYDTQKNEQLFRHSKTLADDQINLQDRGRREQIAYQDRNRERGFSQERDMLERQRIIQDRRTESARTAAIRSYKSF